MKDNKNEPRISDKPIDELDVAENPHSLAYPHSRGGAKITPFKKGAVQQLAMTRMEEQVGMQKQQLMEHIELIKKQMTDLNRRIEISELIYRAKMGFPPSPGSTYFLYLQNDKTVLSMIGPDQWREQTKVYLASVQLLHDHTWKILESVDDFETILFNHSEPDSSSKTD